MRVDFAAYSLSQDTDREVVPTIPACEFFVAFLLIGREVDRFRRMVIRLNPLQSAWC